MYSNIFSFSDEMFSQMSIYYDPVSKEKLRITSIENLLTNRNKYGTKINLAKFPPKILKRIGFRSNGCTCQELNCGCCLGINLPRLNFSREGKLCCMKAFVN